jgi:hypothetical protein
MNAAIFTKSAKGLILASGLIAASSVLGYAQDAPVGLGAQATVPLSTYYVLPPTGTASLGGHSFDMSGGNLIQLANGQSASFAGSWSNAQGAQLLLNSANTYLWYDQTAVGSVTFTFSDGTTQTTSLMIGGNLREWRTGSGNTVSWIYDPAAAQVWLGTAQDGMGGGAAVIDMLSISLPGKTVTGITLTNSNDWGALLIDLAGLTIDVVAPQPQPQPSPDCLRPGNSCNTPAAVNSQAEKWLPAGTLTARSTDTKQTNSAHQPHGTR